MLPPLINFRNLEPSTAIPDSMSVVAVTGSGQTVRVSWDTLTASVPTMVTPPASPVTRGELGQMAVSTTGVFSYVDKTWGKSVRYIQNWDDLTTTTRFLRVDAPMSLTSTEQAYGRATLGIGTANAGRAGLVKPSASVIVALDGTATVPTASASVAGITTKQGAGPAASVEWVQDAIEAIDLTPVLPATDARLGGIISSSTVLVDEFGRATVPISNTGDGELGLVRLAGMTSYTEAQVDWAAPVALAKKIAEDAVAANVRPATDSSAGIVVPSGAINVIDTNGTIDVRTADLTHHGIVRTVDTIPSVPGTDPSLVPTIKAVKDFLTIPDLPVVAERLPYATATTRGAIISSPTVRVQETGANVGQAYVPQATPSTPGVVTIHTASGDPAPNKAASLAYVNATVADATGGIKSQAVNEVKALRPTATEYGLVRVVPSATDTAATMGTVPTMKYVEEFFSENTFWNGGTVTNGAMFAAGLKTPAVAEPDTQDVLNYGQLQELIGAAIPPTSEPTPDYGVRDQNNLWTKVNVFQAGAYIGTNNFGQEIITKREAEIISADAATALKSQSNDWYGTNTFHGHLLSSTFALGQHSPGYTFFQCTTYSKAVLDAANIDVLYCGEYIPLTSILNGGGSPGSDGDALLNSYNNWYGTNTFHGHLLSSTFALGQQPAGYTFFQCATYSKAVLDAANIDVLDCGEYIPLTSILNGGGSIRHPFKLGFNSCGSAEIAAGEVYFVDNNSQITVEPWGIIADGTTYYLNIDKANHTATIDEIPNAYAIKIGHMYNCGIAQQFWKSDVIVPA